MWFLATVRDTITIPPVLFAEDRNEALSLEIEKKYANKVLPDVGLCLCCYDILSVRDSHIYPGDGSAHTDATFRLAVFSPSEGEIMVGTIKSGEADGLVISLGFFDDVHIPPSLMMRNSAYAEDDAGTGSKVWTWEYEGDEEEAGDGADPVKLPLYVGDVVRFRVHAVLFKRQGIADSTRDLLSLEPGVAARPPSAPGGGGLESDDPPMRVIASLTSASGDASELGVVKWWDAGDGGDDDAEGEGGAA
uniref:RNA polymerase III subunit Rpc25 domain-containing protein n=1 Tax=Bicosoecida sp. CB-2014 TaxID=1486930 RepID=A0A7S1C729_9STRA|mmetsp:Transcript_14457/g.50294  ORF Transcript_14457/g.50294 Transcript_14457/m.50294 type:complete len:248 (+) Transcript_14457:196-939(+)